MSEKDQPKGTKDSTDEKFDYQEEYIRQAPPTMEGVKKLPRNEQKRPVAKKAHDDDEGDGERS